MLNRFRRHAVVACLVGAAFITPGSDPLSMLALAGPLYLLFELSVVLSSAVYRRRQRREAAREAEEAAEAAAEAARLSAAQPDGNEFTPRRLAVPTAEPAPFDQQGVL
jgi:sec-independent protein translocase protein TatC